MLNRVINQLDIVANIFGGYQEIVRFVPESQLNYIGAFPGDFLVVAPWTVFKEPVDLTQIGFNKDTLISVYNQNWDFVYSRISDGYFGNDTLDEDLIINAYHGEYFHLSFKVEGVETVFLLWIAKTFDPVTKQRILNFYREKESSKYNRLNYNEIILNSKGLTQTIPIEVYCLQGTWLDLLNPEQIQNSFKKITLSFVNNNSNIYFQPLINYWYCFKQGNDWLRLSNITGIGQESWKDTGYFSYFFEPSLVNNSRFKLTNSNLLSNTSLYNNYKLQLQADLKLPSADLLVRPEIKAVIKSSGRFVINMSFTTSSSRAKTDAAGLTASLSRIESNSLRASVNAVLEIYSAAEMEVYADSSSHRATTDFNIEKQIDSYSYIETYYVAPTTQITIDLTSDFESEVNAESNPATTEVNYRLIDLQGLVNAESNSSTVDALFQTESSYYIEIFAQSSTASTDGLLTQSNFSEGSIEAITTSFATTDITLLNIYAQGTINATSNTLATTDVTLKDVSAAGTLNADTSTNTSSTTGTITVNDND